MEILSSQDLNGTSFNSSVPNPRPTLVDPQVTVGNIGNAVPRNTIIMTLLEGILTMAPSTSSDRIRIPVDFVPPARYNAKIQLVPIPTLDPQRYLTPGLTAMALRQIPAIIYEQVHRWAEIREIYISVGGSLVGEARLVKVGA